MEVKIEHSFTSNKPESNKMNVTLKNSAIFKNPVFIGQHNDASNNEPAVTITTSFNSSRGENYITVPLEDVEMFCKELIAFSEKMKKINESLKK